MYFLPIERKNLIFQIKIDRFLLRVNPFLYLDGYGVCINCRPEEHCDTIGIFALLFFFIFWVEMFVVSDIKWLLPFEL